MASQPTYRPPGDYFVLYNALVVRENKEQDFQHHKENMLPRINRLWVMSLLVGLTACSSVPAVSGQPGATQTGLASYYADMLQGNTTANGERFSQHKKTAAHRTLPFGKRVKVVNLANGKNVVVRINDRGPFVRGRIIDLSKSAFRQIANPKQGVVNVKITVLN